MTGSLDCPCEEFVHPRIVANLPGLTAIDYRIGDYSTFRHALLHALKDEKTLVEWRPSTGTDLGMQLLEWWAYLADVLTFYNERAMHAALLRTAVFPEDVRGIIRLLGYRPRPGIGAVGVVAALTDSSRPFTVPQGFAIRGDSMPGEAAQVFEVDKDMRIGLLGQSLPPSVRPLWPEGTVVTGTVSSDGSADAWTGPAPRDHRGRYLDAADAELETNQTFHSKPGQTLEIVLDGVVASLDTDDVVLILPREWNGDDKDYALLIVRKVKHIWDSAGKAVTNVSMFTQSEHTFDSDDFMILRATKQAHLWLYHERYPDLTNPLTSALGVFTEAADAVQDAINFAGDVLSNPLSIFSGPPDTPMPPQDPNVLTGTRAHLEAITRGISAGDPVLFEQRIGGPLGITALVKVTGYSEEIWYANPPESSQVGFGPPVGPPQGGGGGGGGLLGDIGGMLTGGLFGGGDKESPPSPIPIPHSRIDFSNNQTVGGMMAFYRKGVVVHYGWEEVGHAIEVPDDNGSKDSTVDVSTLHDVPEESRLPVLIEDVTGAGRPGALGETGIPGTELVDGPDQIGQPLVPPLRALLHMLPVSRGQTVDEEVLGSGDPNLIGQEFTLSRSPLTYLADTGVHSPDGYRSTLRIRVDGIEWHEVASFYRQQPDARVFVTREDDEQRTHVRFGDGVNGARLPAGVDNVVAEYRYGSGAARPAAGSLTSILRPINGLKSIRNPVGVRGGEDPDPPEQIRQYAPRSVLTFGRAVSGDDYEVIAMQTPGVKRARAYWSWDGQSQRTVVKVYVGDDDSAVAAAAKALTAFSDPNRPALVVSAKPIFLTVSLVVRCHRDHDAQTVAEDVRTALLDPQAQPFGDAVVRVGQVLYDSHVSAACLSVPGVVAIRDLRMGPVETADILQGERHPPGEGGFYLLRRENLTVHWETADHGI